MNKKVSLIMTSVLVFVLLIGMASATITFGSFNPTELSQAGNSFIVSVTSNQNETLTVTATTITNNGDTIGFTGNPWPVINGTLTDFNITYDPTGFDFELGEIYTTTVTINGSNSSAIIKTVSFKKTDFCGNVENPGDIELEIKDIKVTGFGDDEEFWYLMDEITVEIEVTNDGNYDMDNVEVEWKLYTTDGRKIMGDTEKDFKLKENKDNIIEFTFKLDEDLDDFDGEDAILYVKATGETDDKKSLYNGEANCATDESEIDVITKDDFVIADSFKINGNEFDGNLFSESFVCGSEITFSGKIYNIGEDDQDDVSIEIYSKELEVYEKFEYSEIEAYENEEFTYTFTVPQELDEKNYYIQVEVFDEDNDLYENSENDEALFRRYFEVEGNCKIVEPKVYAKLDGEAISGRETVVVATITNLEDESKLYTIVPEEYSTWSSMIEFSPQALSLQSGESKDVTFKLKLNSDIEGEKTFNIVIMDGDRIVIVQPMTFNVESSVFDFKDYLTRRNLQIAGIVLLNLILLIAIVLVARKIIRKK